MELVFGIDFKVEDISFSFLSLDHFNWVARVLLYFALRTATCSIASSIWLLVMMSSIWKVASGRTFVANRCHDVVRLPFLETSRNTNAANKQTSAQI